MHISSATIDFVCWFYRSTTFIIGCFLIYVRVCVSTSVDRGCFLWLLCICSRTFWTEWVRLQERAARGNKKQKPLFVRKRTQNLIDLPLPADDGGWVDVVQISGLDDCLYSGKLIIWLKIFFSGTRSLSGKLMAFSRPSFNQPPTGHHFLLDRFVDLLMCQMMDSSVQFHYFLRSWETK